MLIALIWLYFCVVETCFVCLCFLGWGVGIIVAFASIYFIFFRMCFVVAVIVVENKNK